jgi:glycosyltransferase involved in cell wall biosynthesis
MVELNISKEEKQPLVSVLIPTYNCAQFIKEAIESVLIQEYDNLEIIVVDDGSTDNTREIVERFGMSIKYFYQNNSGISSARNACLEHVSGEYIAWLDADDYWLPGKLKAQIEYFSKRLDCQIVFTRYLNFFDSASSEKRLKNDPKVQYEIEIAKTNKCYFASTLIKRAVFEKIGRFNIELPVGEDSEMVSRILALDIDVNHLINEVYYYRRLHGNNSVLMADNPHKTTLSYIVKNLREMHKR